MARTSMSSEFDSRLDSLKNGVKENIEAGGERAQDIRATAMSGVNKVGQLIKSHPVAAVAIAFGVGYLMMRLIRR